MPSIPHEQKPLRDELYGVLAYRMNDASRVSGVSKSKLYALAAEGKLALSRVGGRTLVPRSELDRLITEGLKRAVARR